MRLAAIFRAVRALFLAIFGLILVYILCRSKPIVTIYVITPTFYRLTQKPELVRLCNTLSLVEDIHWIVVEDSQNKTNLVANFLSECKVPSTHLNAASPKDRNYHIKGSNQRNAGLQWLRENIVKGKQRGVVYFADDDNTYDPRIFNEMRNLRQGATWPVGIVGGSSWEGCITAPEEPSRIVGFWTGYKPRRSFPIDMAAFAINVDLLFTYPNASFDYKHVEQQEGTLLSQVGFKSALDLEPRANGCSKILVWHTKTSVPKIPKQRPHQPPIADFL
ncbi:Galactosylgalactosylxylosylprotein 3-beta-glucuronosyltransferase 3 [Echinococcus granulosus]|uniref:Galactosylgalactosylxylosylprotein 3-beta-glucuronosyltransferase n=1 Tax=Echinococcus granulosus TaxID=6210 RepID=A0A068WK52_ECHGR|nr:Galactosylgalactosylxylosylprotein 3-beta-glucuronosyltransferase 3 [Echinococcus granulosus]CDS20153.1 beta 13 glucuronyltransferase 3 [Echinococcus granulosus]